MKYIDTMPLISTLMSDEEDQYGFMYYYLDSEDGENPTAFWGIEDDSAGEDPPLVTWASFGTHGGMYLSPSHSRHSFEVVA